jgi:hypothetical protein
MMVPLNEREHLGDVVALGKLQTIVAVGLHTDEDQSCAHSLADKVRLLVGQRAWLSWRATEGAHERARRAASEATLRRQHHEPGEDGA